MNDTEIRKPESGPEQIVNKVGVDLVKQIAKNTIDSIKSKIKQKLNGKSDKQNQ